MDKKYEMPSDTQADIQEASVELDNNFEDELISDQGEDLNDLNNTQSLEETSEQSDYGNMVNIDEMQEEMDLNNQPSEYIYQYETERMESEQFMQENPELFQEAQDLNNITQDETPEYYQNPESDTAVFGTYPDYKEIGEDKDFSHFNSDTYESDDLNARINGEDPYVATGNQDFVESVGGDKELVFTDNPIDPANPLGEGSQREFDQIQEATGITPDDISQDDEGLYHIDTNDTWISPEDRNAEYGDAYENDIGSGEYISTDDTSSSDSNE